MHVTCKIIYMSTCGYVSIYIYSCLLFFVDFSVSVKGHTKLCSSSRESEVSYFCARLRMNTCMYIACSRCIIMYVISLYFPPPQAVWCGVPYSLLPGRAGQGQVHLSRDGV